MRPWSFNRHIFIRTNLNMNPFPRALFLYVDGRASAPTPNTYPSFHAGSDLRKSRLGAEALAQNGEFPGVRQVEPQHVCMQIAPAAQSEVVEHGRKLSQDDGVMQMPWPSVLKKQSPLQLVLLPQLASSPTQVPPLEQWYLGSRMHSLSLQINPEGHLC